VPVVSCDVSMFLVCVHLFPSPTLFPYTTLFRSEWLREGWIDYITPQLYWHIGFGLAEYKTLVQWWSRHTYGKHLYIGQGIYRVGEKGWEDENEIVNQIRYNREFPEVKGSMHFSSKTISQNKLGINNKLAEVQPYPALIPSMPWLDPTAPPAP